MKSLRALIVTDIQNDFCPGGALAVPGGDEIVPLVNRLMGGFDLVAATQDWHPRGHLSFASSHPGMKPYETIDLDDTEQVLWPDHCVQGTPGADFHKQLDLAPVRLIIRKGTDPRIDSYSAFFENDGKTGTGLEGYFKSLGINDLYLCGLATDFCVFYSAMDAAAHGFRTRVILDACRGIDVPAGNIGKAIDAMRSKGIEIIESDGC